MTITFERATETVSKKVWDSNCTALPSDRLWSQPGVGQSQVVVENTREETRVYVVFNSLLLLGV